MTLIRLFFFVTLALVLETQSTAATPKCFTWVGGSHRSTSDKDSSHVWSSDVDTVTFHFSFHVIDSCNRSQTNRIDQTQFRLYVGGQKQAALATLNVTRYGCNVASAVGQVAYFRIFSVECLPRPNSTIVQVYQVFLRTQRPTRQLNGRAIVLETPATEQNDQFISRTPNITIKDCSSTLDDTNVQFKSVPKTRTFNQSVQLHCKHHRAHLFASKNGNFVEPISTPVYAVCGRHATWQYSSYSCWRGPLINVDQTTDHHAYTVAHRPLVIVCRNKDEANVGSVQIQVKNHPTTKKFPTVAWTNVTLKEEENRVLVKCLHFSKENSSTVRKTEILHLSPKKIHFTKPHRKFVVFPGYPPVVDIPVRANFPLNPKHIIIEKNGSHSTNKFVLVNSVKDRYLNVIEVKFGKITPSAFGTYTATIYIDKNEFDSSTFELVLHDASLTPGAKAAIAVSVILSLALIAGCLGYFVKKFVWHQAKLINDDGERILIIEDNEEVVDDVFHDPSRAARMQEELLQRSEGPSSSSAEGGSKGTSAPTTSNLATMPDTSKRQSLEKLTV